MSVAKHRVAVVAIVLNDAGQILLVNDYRRGWELPGGLVEKGESVEEAAIREVHEETGITIEPTQFRFVSHDVSTDTFVFLLSGEYVAGTLRSSSETSDAGYFPIHAALAKMTFKNYNEHIMRCLDSEMSPFFIEYETM